MKKYRLKGQSTLEYAFLVAIVAAAVIGMQFYMKRAVQGRAKQSADEISDPYDSELMQASGITTNVTSHVTVHTQVYPLTGADGEPEFVMSQQNVQLQNVTRTGSEHLSPW